MSAPFDRDALVGFTFSGSASDLLRQYGAPVPPREPQTSLAASQAAKAAASQAAKNMNTCPRADCTKSKCSGKNCAPIPLRKKKKVVRKLR